MKICLQWYVSFKEAEDIQKAKESDKKFVKTEALNEKKEPRATAFKMKNTDKTGNFI